MFNIIIISQNQENYIVPLIESFNKQLPGINRLFVLERTQDNSAKLLTQLNEKFIENTEGEGFLAGKGRDMGLSSMPVENTLFLDGDRILNNFTISLIEQAFILYDVCLIKVENDFREGFKETFSENKAFGLYHNNVFSCGMTIRKEMIEKITLIQDNRLFHKDFDGNFGEEDRFLGDMIYKLNGTCGLFPVTSYLNGSFSKITDRHSYRGQRRTRSSLQKQYSIVLRFL
jgi:hypothetical protein